MGLKHIKLPSAEVEFPGGKFAVRGLSLDDIAYLVRRHKASLEELYDAFQAEGEPTTEAALNFVGPLVQKMPALAADAIACGAGEGGDAEAEMVAAQLPFPVQVEALEHIIVLTFATEGGLKKLMETVVRLAQGTTALIDSLTA